MKIQLAYKFTGENTTELLEMLKKIKLILEKNGHIVYIPALDFDKPQDKKGIYIGTLKKIPNCDAFIAIITSEEKSEGLLMEAGHALGLGKKVITIVNKNIKKTHLRELSNNIFEFEDINEIFKIFEDLK
jgi:nucleoside 2-deoxyribosyltransferase